MTTKYNRLQDSLLQSIINTINQTQFAVSRTDKKASFIDVMLLCKMNCLLRFTVKESLKKLLELEYLNIKTQRQNATVQKLQERVDSIENLLRQKLFPELPYKIYQVQWILILCTERELL